MSGRTQKLSSQVTTMVLCNSCRPLQLCIFFMITLYLPHVTALSFNLTNINPQNLNVSITVESDAYISSQGIQLTPDERSVDQQQKSGRALYIEPLHLWDKASGNLTDFTTHFLFVIDSQGQTNFADGLAFFLIPQGVSNITAGGAMGLPIDPQSINPISPFVAIEFDTFYNPGWDPVNITTHVGIDISSLRSNATERWYNNITYGVENEAWISYDATSKNLSVVFTGFRNSKRIEQRLNFIVDLRDHLPEWVRIGFSASTGAFFEKNNVRSWQFNSDKS